MRNNSLTAKDKASQSSYKSWDPCRQNNTPLTWVGYLNIVSAVTAVNNTINKKWDNQR